MYKGAVDSSFGNLERLAPQPPRGVQLPKLVQLPKVIRSSLIRGCNKYHNSDVMQVRVELGDLAGLRTTDFGPAFPERFSRYFPVVPPPLCNHVSASFYRSRLSSHDGIAASEALLEAVVAVEAAGLREMYYLDRVTYASVIPHDDKGEATLIWESLDPKSSRASLEVAMGGFGELVRHCLGQQSTCLYEDALSRFIQAAAERRLSSSTSVIRTAAYRHGIPFEFITRQQLRVGQGACQQRMFSTMAASTSFGAAKLALDKRLTNRQLAQLSLPVPRQVAVTCAAEAIAALEQLGGTVVVKPTRGNQGRGVSVGIREAQDVVAAFQRASAEGTGAGVVIEECVSGSDYRLTVVGGKFAAALLLVPPEIKGDGIRCVRQLIEELNAEPDRDKMRLSPIAFDDELVTYLGSLGFTLDSVLAPGAIIAVRATGHVSRGGIPIDITDIVHPDNRKASEQAARAVGLDVAGIDFISPDISRSYRQVGGRIVEVNSRPGIGMHLWPRQGKSRDIGAAILDHLYPDPAAASVPILLIAGDRGTGSAARFAEGIMRANGLTVGLSLRHGAYINGVPLDIPQDKLARAPRTLLRDASVEAVIAAVSLPYIAQHGLGFERCDAVSLLFSDPRRLLVDCADGLAILLKANQGYFVVDSRDGAARQALCHLDRSRIVLVESGFNDSEFNDHIAAKGPGVMRRWLVDGSAPELVFVNAGKEVISMPMPSLSRDGRTQVAAAMHAFALVHAAQLRSH